MRDCWLLLFEPIHYASSLPCYSLSGRKKAIRKIPIGNADKRKWVSHLSTKRLRKIIGFGKSLYLLSSILHFLMDSQNFFSRPWLSNDRSISCFHKHFSLCGCIQTECSLKKRANRQNLTCVSATQK